MQSKAATPAAYLKELPADRRAAIAAVREVILANIDDDVDEAMTYGMLGYGIPHRVFPAGYHCDPSKPVPFIALASQKQYMTLYLMTVYADSAEERFLRESYARAGRRLDFGKCCLRFKSLDDIDLDVVAALIRRVPAREHLARYVASVGEGAWKKRAKASAKTAAKPAAKTAAKTKATPKRPAAKK